MLEKRLNEKYEGPARHISPGDIGSEDGFARMGCLSLLIVGVGLVCIGGSYFVADKTKELYEKIIRRK